MKFKTKQLYTAILAGLATNYGVASMSEEFSVEATIEQELHDKVYESAEFLQQINTPMVDDIVGQSVVLSVGGGVTGRAGVETDNKERNTKDPSGLTNREYRCYPTEADTHISWVKMDTWAKFPDFHTRWRNHVRMAMALDIITIGWNGVEAANIRDLDTYPLLQDVNIGWLQLVRRDAPERAIAEGDQTEDEIHIGEGGDYANLDAAVHDLLQGIPVQKRVGMVAIIGSSLLADEKGKVYAKQGHTPTEKQIVELEQVIGTYGGLAAYSIPFFPERGILVTSFDNLSYYVQSGSTRTSVENNSKKKRVDDFVSRNDCYYVEDLEKIIFFEAENVKINRAKDPAVDAGDFDAENPDHWIWS